MNVLIGLALIYLASASGNSDRCAKKISKSDFDLSRFLGVWYEIVRSSNIDAEFGDCNFQQVVLETEGGLTFNNYQRVGDDYDDVSWPGFCDPRQNFLGRCYYKPHPELSWVDYQIISTDYDNYVVAYSCNSSKNSKFDMVWVGGRSKNLDWNLYRDIVIDQLGFTLDELITDVQKDNCPPIPIPV